VIPNFEFEIASARMYSPTNFVVSSEIGSVSTGGQYRRSATIDIARLDPLPEAGGSLRHSSGTSFGSKARWQIL
jgi:hypothetical protein